MRNFRVLPIYDLTTNIVINYVTSFDYLKLETFINATYTEHIKEYICVNLKLNTLMWCTCTKRKLQIGEFIIMGYVVSLRFVLCVRALDNIWQTTNHVLRLKLYCGYKCTRPYMINYCIWDLKQLWLQVNGHDWFHLHRLRWPVRNGGRSEKFKMKIYVPSGIRTQTTRPRWLDFKSSINNLTVFWYMSTNGYVTIPVWYR